MTLLDKLTKVYLDITITAGGTTSDLDKALVRVVVDDFTKALGMITNQNIGPNAMGTLMTAVVKTYVASFDEMLRLFPDVNDAILHISFATYFPNGYEALVGDGVLEIDTLSRRVVHVEHLRNKLKQKKQQLQAAKSLKKQAAIRKRQPSFMTASSDERN